jgi:uridine kinase
VTGRPLFVGIAGGSGSGKTHFARDVATGVGLERVAMLSMDQYFRSNPTERDSRDINFDHPAHLDFRLMSSHLRKLKKGTTIVAPSYDFRAMVQTPNAIEIEPKPVVVVEGLFVLAQPMVELFDITIFLDVDPDQRLLGRILRDARERGASIEELVDRYQRFVRPSYDVFVAPTKQNADIVVDFTYRRILLTKMLTLQLRSFADEGLDLEGFSEELRAECHHLGFTPREGSMPVSIDILKLARDYPESASSTPALR